MTTHKRHALPYRRKRKGYTNYKKRASLIQSQQARLVVRKGSETIISQIVLYNKEGDKMICSATSQELKALGWPYNTKNIPACYLTGLSIGKKAQKNGIKQAVLDLGLYSPTKGSRLFAVLKGAVDAGLEVRHSPDILPSMDRISGKHIADYAQSISGENETGRFSKYASSHADPKEMPATFEKIKNKIIKG